MVLDFVEKYFLCFFLYSVIGWIYESILCSVTSKKPVNRGFLNGPYCPIYGAGAILDILFLQTIKDPILLFLASSVLTCTLEYITSYLMEIIFHARWWDYSDSKYNINGRVCLLGAIVFGILSTLLILVIHPFVISHIEKVPKLIIHIASGVIFAEFVTDIIITVTGFTSFDAHLKEFSDYLGKKKADATNEFERFKKEHVSLRLKSAHEMFLIRLNGQHRRMIKVFPKLQSVKYQDALTRLRKNIGDFKKHKLISKQIKK